MAQATYEITSFLGGEVSLFYQSRYDNPSYRSFQNVMLNAYPTEEGTWVRRPGTGFAGTTRGGLPGRVIKFDFEAASAYTLEFTDGWLRFRHGATWATTNDAVGVLAISGANPAMLQTAAAVTWSTGNTVTLADLGATAPVLQNRQLALTKVDTTHFSLTDAITGATIDGSTLGAISNAAMVSRIHELTTPYIGGGWGSLRIVQAVANNQPYAVTLQGALPPQILQVATLPTTALDAQFSLSALTFLDGPYLDPFTNGVQATPSAEIGLVTLTLSFPAYVSTQAYKAGDFVLSSSVNYISLADNNVGNTPASSPTFWAATSVAAAINGGKGFLGTDVGRLVRLLSEPAVWAAATPYAGGNLVSYNPSGVAGAETYWTSLTSSNTGNIPGNDLTHWEPTPSNASVWSWGKIVSLSNAISQQLSGSVNIGNMTPLSASFDGVSNKASGNCSRLLENNGSNPNIPVTLRSYIGKNYSGASAQKINSAVIYPSSDFGIVTAGETFTSSGQPVQVEAQVTVNLRAKQTAPSGSGDGTLLATSSFTSNTGTNMSALALVSSDQATAWNYVWVEVVSIAQFDSGTFGQFSANYSAQVYFFNPPGTGTSTGVTVELLGPPLLYTNPIVNWRLGVYSNTTGWPTCGCFHEGRLWLAGAVSNRFDASVSNGISGTTVNFAPTDQNGVVADSNAIDEVMNSDGINAIQWMQSDQQGVIVGTLAGGWLIAPPGPGAMTPTNVAARTLVIEGGSVAEPRRTGHTLAYVHRYGRKLMECFADVYSGKLSAPNLAERAMHIPKPGIAELAYTHAVTPIIWGRNQDGSWWGITYKRDVLSTQAEPKFYGWHRHALGSGRTLASIAAGPSVDGTLDALTMVTVDALNNYHVEVLTDLPPEGSALTDAAYCDDAVTPSSTTTTNAASTGAPYGGLTLNGLWHLNGQTVTAWLGGLDCGDYVVANGSITVPYGDSVSAGTGAGLFTAAYVATFGGAMPMVVGFTFTSQGQSVRPNTPAESGARNGPALGKLRRTHQYAAQLEGAGYDGGQGGSLSFGTDPAFVKMDPARFRQPNDVAYTVLQQFTGVYRNTLRDTDSYDSMLGWCVTRPYPANLAALAGFLDTKDG